MKEFHTLTSHVVPLDNKDVDTDQIIPARFLTTTSKDGLGEHLFEDWRKHPDGSEKPDFVLNHPGDRSAQILLAGSNFGCGSSSGVLPARLVEPKAAILAFSHFISLARSKNSASFGFDPGQPPSMKATPNRSSRDAMRSLSSQESEMPSRWVPSLRVVS